MSFARDYFRKQMVKPFTKGTTYEMYVSYFDEKGNRHTHVFFDADIQEKDLDKKALEFFEYAEAQGYHLGSGTKIQFVPVINYELC